MDSCGAGFYASGFSSRDASVFRAVNVLSSCFDASTCEGMVMGTICMRGSASLIASGTYADGGDSSTGRECVDCSQNCLGCTNATTCLFCGSSKHLYSDACVDRCPQAILHHGGGGTVGGCACHAGGCDTCSNSNTCQMWFRAVSAERRLCCCLSCWSGITWIWCHWAKV